MSQTRVVLRLAIGLHPKGLPCFDGYWDKQPWWCHYLLPIYIYMRCRGITEVLLPVRIYTRTHTHTYYTHSHTPLHHTYMRINRKRIIQSSFFIAPLKMNALYIVLEVLTNIRYAWYTELWLYFGSLITVARVSLKLTTCCTCP